MNRGLVVPAVVTLFCLGLSAACSSAEEEEGEATAAAAPADLTGKPVIQRGEAPAPGGAPRPKAAGIIEPVKILARQLWNKYEVDEAAADEELKGEILRVTGDVTDIGADYATLSGGEEAAGGVKCTFREDEITSLATLKVGESASVIGRADGKVGDVQLSGCLMGVALQKRLPAGLKPNFSSHPA